VDEEPEAALLRLVELVARVSLSSREELGDGSMVGEFWFTTNS
jgi:hypothetical protein